ncbi:MAG: helix-turn-helix domain-containing protein [Aggregatilineales bacterium]
MSFDFGYRESDSPLVEHIWTTTSESNAGSFISSAACHLEMVVTKQQGNIVVTVMGPETRAKPSPIPDDAEFFGITFKIGTYLPHLPTTHLVNNGINLPDATSRSFWFYGSAWEFPTFENADNFLNRMVKQGMLVRDPIVEAVLAEQGQGTDLSLRSIQRRFVHTTGLTYKMIQQIERAKKAMTLLEQGMPILDTAFETGYYDQSHLTNALKELMGRTPAQIAQITP